MEYHNPILRGFHPDPSVCRVGEDFYLVMSSFTYFPGIPVFHSRNLINWSLVGHCLTRDSQIQLEESRNSRGIFAPTIRYHDRRFFVIVTDVDGIGNFLVHTQLITGSWSEPVPVAQNGIDPSLFWDEDGTCWYCGKGILDGQRGIVAFILNPLTGEILSDKYLISKGCGGKCAEGPHIYKKDGWYYLVTAEGGTQYSHRAVIQRSRKLTSGYQPCPHNPLLSHEEQNWRTIQAVGHTDLFEDQNGNWWGVCLGIRMFGDILLHNLGRETLLVPVVWRDCWPQMGKDGCVEVVMDGPLPGSVERETVQPIKKTEAVEFMQIAEKDSTVREIWTFDYKSNRIPADFCFIRKFNRDCYQLDKGRLVLQGKETEIDNATGSPTCILREQQEFIMEATTCLNPMACSQGRFGMIAYYSNYNHYDIAVVKESKGCRLTLYKHIHDLGAITEEVLLETGISKLWLKIRADKAGYYFEYSFDCQNWDELGRGAIAGLCTEGMMQRSYTGTMIGMFAEHGQGVFEDRFSMISERQEENFIHGISK